MWRMLHFSRFKIRSSRLKILAIVAGLAVAVSGATLCWMAQKNPRWTSVAIGVPVVHEGLQFRQWQFSHSGHSFSAIAIAFLPSAVQADVLDLPTGLPSSLENLRIESNAMIAFNGGYFDQEFRPVGLCRIAGQAISPRATAASLSAAILISESGRIQLAKMDDPQVASSASAIQCGPFLVDPESRPGIRSTDGPAAERTVLATDGTHVCLIITGPVSLYDLSQILVIHSDHFGLKTVERAVNLDGGPSTGLAASVGGWRSVQEPRGRIRNAVLLRATGEKE